MSAGRARKVAKQSRWRSRSRLAHIRGGGSVHAENNDGEQQELVAVRYLDPDLFARPHYLWPVTD